MEQQVAQQAELQQRIPQFDAVITTAAVPGRPAPKLVTAAAVAGMRPGSVIVDLAAEAGGNCELTEPGREVDHDGVRVVGLTNLLWLPLSGALSDKIGRRPFLLACTMLALVTAYPAMSWLVAAPSFGKLLAVELWLSFIFGCWNGAMIPFLTEIMPAEVRTAGFSLAYSLATAIFGGFTPMIVTWLIHVTGNKAMPGAWLSLAALCGLLATLVTLGLESEVNVEVQPAAAAVAA